MISSSEHPASDRSSAGRELVILPARERARSRHYLRNMGIVGFCIVAAAGLGWGAGTQIRANPSPDPVIAAAERAESDRLAQEAVVARRQEMQKLEVQRQEMRQLADEVRSLKEGFAGLQTSLARSRSADDVKALRASLEAMKQGLDSSRSDTAGAISQLSGKLDKVDQATAQKLAKIVERLDQLERKPDPMPVGSIVPQPPPRAPAVQALAAPPAPQPPAKPAEAAAPQKQPIPGFVLRDVYQGTALIEGRGGYREVQVGDAIPGAGRIESIERQGRRWVVFTTQGLIRGVD
jgi:hypothetical protein